MGKTKKWVNKKNSLNYSLLFKTADEDNDGLAPKGEGSRLLHPTSRVAWDRQGNFDNGLEGEEGVDALGRDDASRVGDGEEPRGSREGRPYIPTESEWDASSMASRSRSSKKAMTAERRKENLEAGFPDDGYDYLKHLRTIGTGGVSTFVPAVQSTPLVDDIKVNMIDLLLLPLLQVVDATHVRVPKAVTTQDEGISGESGPLGSFYTRASGALPHLDPEIAALLEDDVSVDGDGGELEDDFVVCANAGDGRSDRGREVEEKQDGEEEEEEEGMRSHHSRSRARMRGVEDEEEEDGDEEYEDYEGSEGDEEGEEEEEEDGWQYDDDEEEDEGDEDEDEEGGSPRRRGPRWAPARGGMPTTGQLDERRRPGELDEMFENLALHEYGDDEIGELDPDEPSACGRADLSLFSNVIDEFLHDARANAAVTLAYQPPARGKSKGTTGGEEGRTDTAGAARDEADGGAMVKHKHAAGSTLASGTADRPGGAVDHPATRQANGGNGAEEEDEEGAVLEEEAADDPGSPVQVSYGRAYVPHREELEEYEEPAGDAWDCETIISTLSNLDNHPGRISEPSRRKPRKKASEDAAGVQASSGNADRKIIRLTGPHALPSGYNPAKPAAAAEASARDVQGGAARGADAEEDEEDGREARRLGARPRDETPEEKKARKAAVKEMQRQAKAAKKATKEMFKSEQLRHARMVPAVAAMSIP
eukprot:jgi/Mesvir1/345/Mv22749-RA.1